MKIIDEITKLVDFRNLDIDDISDLNERLARFELLDPYYNQFLKQNKIKDEALEFYHLAFFLIVSNLNGEHFTPRADVTQYIRSGWDDPKSLYEVFDMFLPCLNKFEFIEEKPFDEYSKIKDKYFLINTENTGERLSIETANSMAAQLLEREIDHCINLLRNFFKKRLKGKLDSNTTS